MATTTKKYIVRATAGSIRERALFTRKVILITLICTLEQNKVQMLDLFGSVVEMALYAKYKKTWL